MDDTQLASEVMAKIERDVQERETKIAELSEQLPALEEEKDAAWDMYVKDGPDSPIDRDAERRYDNAWDRVNGMLKAIAGLHAEIKRLRSGHEFDRRMEVHNRLKGVRSMADKTPKQTARDQGVPEVYLNKETGTFRIGMDARLKSDLVNAALGIESKEALHEFNKTEAEKLIKVRGWDSFLARKQEIVAAKAAKAQERQAEKEQAARERAAEKEKKAQAKATASKAKEAAQAKPDPKAGAKK